MIITCKECSTRFSLDELLLKAEGSKVRCSVCKSVFTAYPPQDGPAVELTDPSDIPPPADDDTPPPAPGPQAFESDEPVHDITDEFEFDFDSPTEGEDAAQDTDAQEMDDLAFDEGDADIFDDLDGIKQEADAGELQVDDLDASALDAGDLDTDELDAGELDVEDPGLSDLDDPPDDALSDPDPDIEIRFDDDDDVDVSAPEEEGAADTKKDAGPEFSFDDDDFSFEGDLSFDTDMGEDDSHDTLEDTDVELDGLDMDNTPKAREEDPLAAVLDDLPETDDDLELPELNSSELEAFEEPAPDLQALEPDEDLEGLEPPALDVEDETGELVAEEDPEEPLALLDDDAPLTMKADVSEAEAWEEAPALEADAPAMDDLEALELEDPDVEPGREESFVVLDGDPAPEEEPAMGFAQEQEDPAPMEALEMDESAPQGFEDISLGEPLEEDDAYQEENDFSEEVPSQEDGFTGMPALEEAAEVADTEDNESLEADAEGEAPADPWEEAHKATAYEFLDQAMKLKPTDDDDPPEDESEDPVDPNEFSNFGEAASLDEEIAPEDKEFSDYDAVLEQPTDPAEEEYSQDTPPPIEIHPPVDPAATAALDEPEPHLLKDEETDVLSFGPLMDPAPAKRRRKKAGMGAPIKVLATLFFALVVVYVVNLVGGLGIPVISDLKIPMVESLLKKESAESRDVNAPKPRPDQSSVKGRFVINDSTGDLFVITGNVANPARIPYADIQVKGTLFKKGKVAAISQVAFCGNIISEEVLKSGNIADITAQLTVPGSSTVSAQAKPGGTVPFMLVFSDLPEDLQNFTVEVADFKKEK